MAGGRTGGRVGATPLPVLSRWWPAVIAAVGLAMVVWWLAIAGTARAAEPAVTIGAFSSGSIVAAEPAAATDATTRMAEAEAPSGAPPVASDGPAAGPWVLVVGAAVVMVAIAGLRTRSRH